MGALLDNGPVIFERGDKIYLTTKVQRFAPTTAQIDELAFATQVRKQAPNDNLMWLNGQYVEADNANMNGAMWTSGDLAIASLTPNLMPVTVMHDPRTAVGTIADSKLLTPEADRVARARIDTVLAIWAHRFPDVAEEAGVNIDAGTLMQSMECWSPWYECSSCGMVFQKLPKGAERANWCSHLQEAEAQGAVRYAAASDGRQSDAARILRDVCFTGTGLIFGTRGATGAYTEAHLSDFEDEVAEWHQRLHTDTASTTPRSPGMAMVQIEESELAILRKERDDAKAETATAVTTRDEALRLAETQETERKAAEERATAAEAKSAELEEAARADTLASTRMGTLGDGFTGKLGEIAKANLTADARTLSDEQWDTRLREVEETAGVKRDAKGDGSTVTPPANPEDEFSGDELASLGRIAATVEGGGTVPSRSTSSTVGQLADIFRKDRVPAGRAS